MDKNIGEWSNKTLKTIIFLQIFFVTVKGVV